MGPEVIIFVAFFVTVFGLYFLRSRENMTMIEKGINPRRSYGEPNPYAYMKYALLFIGAGAGLFLAYMTDMTVLRDMSKRVSSDGDVYYQDNPAIYFALLAIGGGIGLFCAYKIEKKHWLDKPQHDDQA